MIKFAFMEYRSVNIISIIIHSFAIIVLTYTLILKSILSDVDNLDATLKNAGTYNHMSTVIKKKLIAKLPQDTRNPLVTNAIGTAIINAVITPDLLSRHSEPVLSRIIRYITNPDQTLGQKIAIRTEEFKKQLQETPLGNLPDLLVPVVRDFRNAVPDELEILNFDKNPRGVIPTLIRGRAFYQNLNTINIVAITAAILSVLALVLANLKYLKRLLKTLSLGYLVAGLVILALSFLIPFVIMPLYPVTNIDPVIVRDVNAMVNDLSAYLFKLTRTPAVIILLVSLIFYLLYRWSYLDRFQKSSVSPKKNQNRVKR